MCYLLLISWRHDGILERSWGNPQVNHEESLGNRCGRCRESLRRVLLTISNESVRCPYAICEESISSLCTTDDYPVGSPQESIRNFWEMFERNTATQWRICNDSLWKTFIYMSYLPTPWLTFWQSSGIPAPTPASDGDRGIEGGMGLAWNLSEYMEPLRRGEFPAESSRDLYGIPINLRVINIKCLNERNPQRSSRSGPWNLLVVNVECVVDLH